MDLASTLGYELCDSDSIKRSDSDFSYDLCDRSVNGSVQDLEVDSPSGQSATVESSKPDQAFDNEKLSSANDSHTLCSQCDCLAWTSPYDDDDDERPNRATRDHLFHRECSTCSTPSQDSDVCAFCCHMRLRHILFCKDDGAGTASRSCHIIIGSPHQLEQRQQDGCTVCNLFWQVFSKSDTTHLPAAFREVYSLRLTLSKADPDFEDPVEIGLDLIDEDGNIEHRCSPIKSYDLERFTTTDIAQLEGNASTPRSSIDWARLRYWYQSCCTDHSKCEPPKPFEPPHDFRVIDVHRWCLVQIRRPISYLALSYVWGPKDSCAVAALKSNVKSLEVEGSLQRFGLNDTGIYDAIVACDKLGFGYLWIDRLCIVQDDDSEKQQHIAAMDTIYSRAAFVLVHCTGMGFRDRIPGVAVERPSVKHSVSHDRVHYSTTLPRLRPTISKSVWASRGWTYQEGALARARLYFTAEQAVFECDTGRLSEDNQENDQPWLSYDRVETCTVTRSMLSVGRIKANSCFNLWRWHVGGYNARQLSFDADVYDAFAGITHIIYGTSTALHFGLPLDEFNRSLLWHIDTLISSTDAIPRSSATAIIPSWSWASMSGAVTCNDDAMGYICPLVDWYLSIPSGAAMRWSALYIEQEMQSTFRPERRRKIEDTHALQLRWTAFTAATVLQCHLAFYAALPSSWQARWLCPEDGPFTKLKITLHDHIRTTALTLPPSVGRMLRPATLAGCGQIARLTISEHVGHNGTGTSWACQNAGHWTELHNESGIVGFLAPRGHSYQTLLEGFHGGLHVLALSLGMLDYHAFRLSDHINCMMTCYGHGLDYSQAGDPEAQLRLNRPMDLTFWHDETPLIPIPIVNVMAIEQHGSAWKRVSIGWVLLTKWIKLRRCVENITLV